MRSEEVRGRRACLPIALAALIGVATLSGCSSGPSSADKELWSELSRSDQSSLCSAYWNDEGFQDDKALFRSMLTDEQIGPGLPSFMADAVYNMVTSGVGCR